MVVMTLADAMTEWIQSRPVHEQIQLVQAQDPKALERFFAFATAAQPQLLGRFLVWSTDLLPLRVCEVEDCGEVATHTIGVKGRDVCDNHGEDRYVDVERAS